MDHLLSKGSTSGVNAAKLRKSRQEGNRSSPNGTKGTKGARPFMPSLRVRAYGVLRPRWLKRALGLVLRNLCRIRNYHLLRNLRRHRLTNPLHLLDEL